MRYDFRVRALYSDDSDGPWSVIASVTVGGDDVVDLVNGLALIVTPSSVREPATGTLETTVTVQLVIAALLPAGTSLTVSTRGGTATLGADFDDPGSRAVGSFEPPGNASPPCPAGTPADGFCATVVFDPFVVRADEDIEDPETVEFYVQLTDRSGQGGDAPDRQVEVVASLTIVDVDKETDFILSVSPAVVSELDAGPGGTAERLSVTLRTADPVPAGMVFNIGVPTGSGAGGAGAGTATVGQDFLPVAPVELRLPTGQRSASVVLEVTILPDREVEGAETFQVAALDVSGQPRDDVAPAIVTIADVPQLVLREVTRVPEPDSGTEETAAAPLEINHPDPNRSIRLNVGIATLPYAGGDETFAPAIICDRCSGADVVPMPTMQVDPSGPGHAGSWVHGHDVAAGALSAFVDVGIIVGDGIPEPTEQFYLYVEIDGHPFTRVNGRVEILERYERIDQPGSISVEFPGTPPGDYRLPEDGATPLEVELAESIVGSETVRFEAQTLDGSAVAGVDYRPLSAELVFDRGRRRFLLPPGQYLSGIPDRFPEGDKGFFLQLFAFFPNNPTAYFLEVIPVSLVDNDRIAGATGEYEDENLWVGPAVSPEALETGCLLADSAAPPIYVQEPPGYQRLTFELPLAAALQTVTGGDPAGGTPGTAVCQPIDQPFEVDVHLRQSGARRAAGVGRRHDISLEPGEGAGPHRVTFEVAGGRPVVELTVHGDPAVEPEEHVDVIVDKGIYGTHVYPVRIVDYQAEQQLLDARRATMVRAGRMMGGFVGDALADRFSCASSPGCSDRTPYERTGWIPGNPQRRPPGALWRDLLNRGSSLLRSLGGPWSAATDFGSGALRNGALGGVSALLPAPGPSGRNAPGHPGAALTSSQTASPIPLGTPVLSDPGFVPAGLPASVRTPVPMAASPGSFGAGPGGMHGPPGAGMHDPSDPFARFANPGYRPDLLGQLDGIAWSRQYRPLRPMPLHRVRNLGGPSSLTVWLRTDYLRIGEAMGSAGVSDTSLFGALGGFDYSFRRDQVLGVLTGVSRFRATELWSDELAALEQSRGLGRTASWLHFGPYWGWQPHRRLRAWGSWSYAWAFSSMTTRTLGFAPDVSTDPCPPVERPEPVDGEPVDPPDPTCHHPEAPDMQVIVGGASGTLWQGRRAALDLEADTFRVLVAIPSVDRHDAIRGVPSSTVLSPVDGLADPAAARSGGTDTAQRERVGLRLALPVGGRGSRFVVTTSLRRDTGVDIEQAYGIGSPWAVDLGVDLRRALGRSRGSSVNLTVQYQVATLRHELDDPRELPDVYGVAAVWRIGRSEKRSGWSGEVSQRFGSVGMNGMLEGPMMQSLGPAVLHRMESIPVVGARGAYAFAEDIELAGSVTHPLVESEHGPMGMGSRIEAMLTAGW